MRKNIVAGNWKMNKTYDEGIALAKEITSAVEAANVDVQVIMCSPFIHVKELADVVKGSSNVAAGAQNCSKEPKGAFTGEISAEMVQSTGAEYVILGHSERREYFGESNDLLAKKVDIVLENGLSPIYCCGEVLAEREAGNHFDVVKSQIEEGIFHLSVDDIKKTVIAYEPVWAIGTGVTASSDQAQEIHAFIREILVDKYGADVAEEISILYGGSCNPKNAQELFANKDVDGGLIGGAALKADDFLSIIKSF